MSTDSVNRLCGKQFEVDLFVVRVANPWSLTLMVLQEATFNSNLWMLVEQLTHEGRSTSCGGQDEDVCSSAGVGRVEGGSGEALVTRLIRGLRFHLAHRCRTLAAVVSVAHGAKSELLGGEGTDGRVLDGYRCQG